MVWPTCGSSVTRRDTSKNAQNPTLDTNSNPNLDHDPNPDPAPTSTHINFGKNQAVFFLENNARWH